jgi:hypothetical protein
MSSFSAPARALRSLSALRFASALSESSELPTCQRKGRVQGAGVPERAAEAVQSLVVLLVALKGCTEKLH